MREITSHRIGLSGDSDVNADLRVETADDPDPVSGANNRYAYSFNRADQWEGSDRTRIIFATKKPNKDIGEMLDGLTNESILAMVKDRLEGFQKGKYPCRENACAITKIDEALMWLQRRTAERTVRGVIGERKQ